MLTEMRELREKLFPEPCFADETNLQNDLTTSKEINNVFPLYKGEKKYNLDGLNHHKDKDAHYKNHSDSEESDYTMKTNL